jgi:hypothetical protein
MVERGRACLKEGKIGGTNQGMTEECIVAGID